ncbi:MAG: hypothetical protein NTZ17_11935 [Phycisphaerae bacterium]|nr:hypothetical protein [Phycisphaerae bacterium]
MAPCRIRLGGLQPDSVRVDGVEAARDTQAGLAASTRGLYIGAGNTLAPRMFWSGLIDDVRIYNRVVKP